MGDAIFTRRFSLLEEWKPITATGGTITTIGNYKYHAFTSVGTSTFTVTDTGTDGELEYLIVGGGGGGGYRRGGGGGAGGVLTNVTTNPIDITTQSYTIVVGNSGREGRSPRNTTRLEQLSGGNSSAFGLTSIGGGRGGNFDDSTSLRLAPAVGGSGGGAANQGSTLTGANGTSGQGNKGGNANSTEGIPYAGAGGGGATAVGTNVNTSTGGAGINLSAYFPNWGTNASNTLTGTRGYFAGGGGGGLYAGTSGSAADEFRVGGVGGGGRGQSYNGPGGTTSVMDGLPNTGGGGGGGTTNGSLERSGKGGSGIVLIRYPLVKPN